MYFCPKFEIFKYFCTNFEIYLFKFYTDQAQVTRACCVNFFCPNCKNIFVQIDFLKIARISRREFDADVRKREERRQISSQSLQALLSGCGLTTVVTQIGSGVQTVIQKHFTF